MEVCAQKVKQIIYPTRHACKEACNNMHSFVHLATCHFLVPFFRPCFCTISVTHHSSGRDVSQASHVTTFGPWGFTEGMMVTLHPKSNETPYNRQSARVFTWVHREFPPRSHLAAPFRARSEWVVSWSALRGSFRARSEQVTGWSGRSFPPDAIHVRKYLGQSCTQLSTRRRTAKQWVHG